MSATAGMCVLLAYITVARVHSSILVCTALQYHQHDHHPHTTDRSAPRDHHHSRSLGWSQELSWSQQRIQEKLQLLLQILLLSLVLLLLLRCRYQKTHHDGDGGAVFRLNPRWSGHRAVTVLDCCYRRCYRRSCHRCRLRCCCYDDC